MKKVDRNEKKWTEMEKTKEMRKKLSKKPSLAVSLLQYPVLLQCNFATTPVHHMGLRVVQVKLQQKEACWQKNSLIEPKQKRNSSPFFCRIRSMESRENI